MKNQTLILTFLLLTPGISFGQKEKTIESKITDVTVFMTGAQVTRKASSDLDAGRTVLLFKGLSHLMDKSTISLNAGGDVTVMAIKHRLEYLSEKKDDPKIKRLKDSIASITERAEEIIVKFQVLRQRESYLANNRKMETGSQHFDPQKFKELHAYYGTQFSNLTNAKHDLNKDYIDLVKRRYQFINQLRALENPQTDETSTVEILVMTEKRVQPELVLKYSVAGAGWTPSYDIKVDELDKPINVIYKANVAQNTGEDWTNVKLVFSNGNPQQNNTLPTLSTYYLSYVNPYAYVNMSNQMYEAAKENMSLIKEKTITGRVLDSETGLPLPYATISTSIGKIAVTDIHGDFTADVSESVSSIVVNYIGYSDVRHNLVNGANIVYMNSAEISAYKEASSREEKVTTSGQELNFNIGGTLNTNRYMWSNNGANFTVQSNSENLYSQYDVVRKKSSFAGRRMDGKSISSDKGVVLAQPIENNISLEFKMAEKYTIRSNGKPEVLEMTRLGIPASFEYHTVPKIEESAFLMAHVVDWAQYNLLPGETNLYLGETYIGKSELDVYYVSDTLNISLGRDPSVTVKREKVKEFSGRQFLGTDNVDKRQFRIRIMNNKSTEISVVVLDQVPLTSSKQISVEVGGLSGASYNEETGEVKKAMKIKSGGIAEMDIKYTVKYPKGKSINLE